ncbi:MAG: HAD family phosphatase [Candidatus Marinimicrobia bacterium]|nr:HAD family phosphatase [Candidatus Neomarinimicrobiota bacterium]
MHLNQLINHPDLGRLKAILFDFDGVVVQSEEVYDRATKKLGEMYGVQIPAPFYEDNRGISEALFYEKFLAEFELDVEIASLQKKGKKLLWAEF